MVDVVSTYPLPTSSDVAAAYDAASGTIYVHRTAAGYYADANEYAFAGWERTDR